MTLADPLSLDPLSLAWLDWMAAARIPAHTVARRRAVLRSIGNAGAATRGDVERWTSRAHLSAATRANVRCYCGHETCHAFASWQALPEVPSDATTTPTHDGRAWAAREEGSSWLDKM